MEKFNVRFFWFWGMVVPMLLCLDLVLCIYFVAGVMKYFGVK